ncbi:MAG TPA: hypothetical protein VI485_03145 [Vicinamibacterales bacterium]|nr:hypothetical protein [Vicinamibacterales bacterium]
MTARRDDSAEHGRDQRQMQWLPRFIALLVVAIAAVSSASLVEATPAYGRRYGVACTTCHAPLPPRLNNVGILFRKLGFRMPDADDEGRLIIKPVPAHDIGEAASIVADLAGRRDKEAELGESRTTFELSEVELVAGTAIGDHVSGQAMFVPWDDGEIELENAEVQFNGGSARHQFVARGGLMQTYAWQKPTHGRLTLSTPLLFASRAVEGVGPFGGFGLGVSQVGAELGYVFSRLRDGRLSSTMLSAALLNGVDHEGEEALRNTTEGIDVYLQGLQLFGERQTIGGFYYRGRSFLDADPDEGLLAPDKQRFARYGVIGNYVLLKRFDVVAGGALGWDRSPLRAEDVRFGGFFTEVDAQVTPYLIGVYRFDRVDPNRDEDGDAARAHTFSTTVRADDHLYLTGEYQRRRLVDGDKPWAVIVSARLTY